MMDVSFVEALESGVALNDRVVGARNNLPHARPAVGFELGADELHDRVRIAKAVGRTMNRHEPAALVDVAQQRLLLLRLNPVDVRVEQ
jgi:hypothetical protein